MLKTVESLTNKEILDEEDALLKRFRELREVCDEEGGGGSPGEWMIERLEDLAAEYTKRCDRDFAPITKGD